MVLKYKKCSYCGKLYVVGTTHYHIINVSSGNRGGKEGSGGRVVNL